MTQTNLKAAFFKYVSLNVIGMIGLSCYILADTFFIAQGIGANGLAALNLAIPVYSFISGTGLMIGMGGATRFAISKSKSIFTESIYYVTFAAVLFLIAGIFFSGEISVMLGADGQTQENVNIYLKTILCFAPMFLLNNLIICFVRNDGNPKLPMAAMLTGSLSNIILDYIFIFPLKMGMFGAAFATGIAPVISLLILSVHFIKKKNTFKISPFKPQLKAIGDISALGISALITELSSGIVIIVFNYIILKSNGNTGVAAYGIIANIALVVISIFTGISQGMQPIISRFFGTNNINDAKKILKYGFITAIFTAIIVYIMSAIFAVPIVQVFNKDADLQLTEIAVNGLLIYFTSFLFAGINIVCATYFSSTQSPKKAFAISLLRGFLVIIPAAFILSAVFGINGTWISVTVTELLVLSVSVIWLRKV